MKALEYIRSQPVIRAIIPNSNGLGNHANTLNFLQYIISRGFQGDIELIYHPSALKKIGALLGYDLPKYPIRLKGSILLGFEDAKDIVFIPWDYFEKNSDEFDWLDIAITGGEPSPKSADFVKAIKVGQLLCSQPYTHTHWSAPFIVQASGEVYELPQGVGKFTPNVVVKFERVLNYLKSQSDQRSQNLLKLLQMPSAVFQSIYGLNREEVQLNSPRISLLINLILAARQHKPNEHIILLVHHPMLQAELKQLNQIINDGAGLGLGFDEKLQLVIHRLNIKDQFIALALEADDLSARIAGKRVVLVSTGNLSMALCKFLMRERSKRLPPVMEGENSRSLLSEKGRPYTYAPFSDTKLGLNDWPVPFIDSTPESVKIGLNKAANALLPVNSEQLAQWGSNETPVDVLAKFYQSCASPYSEIRKYFSALVPTINRYDILLGVETENVEGTFDKITLKPRRAAPESIAQNALKIWRWLVAESALPQVPIEFIKKLGAVVQMTYAGHIQTPPNIVGTLLEYTNNPILLGLLLARNITDTTLKTVSEVLADHAFISSIDLAEVEYYRQFFLNNSEPPTENALIQAIDTAKSKFDIYCRTTTNEPPCVFPEGGTNIVECVGAGQPDSAVLAQCKYKNSVPEVVSSSIFYAAAQLGAATTFVPRVTTQIAHKYKASRMTLFMLEKFSYAAVITLYAYATSGWYQIGASVATQAITSTVLQKILPVKFAFLISNISSILLQFMQNEKADLNSIVKSGLGGFVGSLFGLVAADCFLTLPNLFSSSIETKSIKVK